MYLSISEIDLDFIRFDVVCKSTVIFYLRPQSIQQWEGTLSPQLVGGLRSEDKRCFHHRPAALLLGPDFPSLFIRDRLSVK